MRRAFHQTGLEGLHPERIKFRGISLIVQCSSIAEGAIGGILMSL